MGYTEPLWRAATFLGVLAVTLLAERLRPLLPVPSGRWRVRAANLALATLGPLLVRLLLPGAAVGAALWASAHQVGLLQRAPAALAAVTGFLALDVAVYLQHRAFHRLRWLWWLHAVHHSERHLDATTGLRFHPGEILVSMLWKIAVVVVLGIPAAAVFAFEVALNAASLATHANLALPPDLDRALRRVLVTPAMHRWHHSTRLEESLTNFGFSLALWDRWFGTYDGRDAVVAAPIIGPPGIAAPGGTGPGLWRLLLLKVF